MKYLLFSVLFLGCVTSAFAQKEILTQAANQYSLKQVDRNVLEEEESTKALILKYSSADSTTKPAVKKDIEKKELLHEEERITKQKQRIKRQEEQVKLAKQKLEEREKNKKETVRSRVAYLVSDESIDKIKNESNTKKAIDKVKTKTKKK